MSSLQTKITKNIVLVMFTIVTVFLISVNTSNSQDNARPQIWTASAMEAIRLDQPSPNITEINSDELRSVQLSAAKGEYEALQIVIKAPPGNLNQVDVVVSGLVDADNHLISSDNITLFREHYIRLDRPSPDGWKANPTRGKGWYADGLIPFVDPDTGQDIEGAELDAVPFDLTAGQTQPIWVDIFVPRSTVPGDYRGTYTVKSDRGIIEGVINLKVWNFELPVKPSIHSAFDIWKDRGIEARLYYSSID